MRYKTPALAWAAFLMAAAACAQQAGSAATGGQDEHADVDLAIEHQCAGTAALRQLDLGPLLDAFKGIARLEARIVTPAGQFKATLKRPARVLAWGR